MTATLETAAIVFTLADGEAREARLWPFGEYTCPFCDGVVVAGGARAP